MISITLLSLALAAPPTDSWTGFRNDGTGRTEAKNLPIEWDGEQNIAWKIATPGYGQSSPVVWQDRIYVTAVDGAEKETLIVSCYATKDGKELWSQTFDATQRGKNSRVNSRAPGTPVADGQGVVAFFESGDLIALSPEGKVRWQRSLVEEYGELKNNHGLGCSPVQTEGAVIVLIDHAGPSYLLAVNKKDGTNLWKTDRKSRSSWTSPVIGQVDGKPVVVVSSNGSVAGYEADSGKQLWELADLAGNNIPSATVIGDKVLVAASEGRGKTDINAVSQSNCCLQLTDSEAGYSIVWRAKRLTTSMPSPVAVDGHVYFVDKAGVVHCLDLATGEEKYAERLENQQWATPVAAEGRIYFFGKDGVTTVVKTGPEFDVIANNRLWSQAEFNKRKKEAAEKAKELEAKSEAGSDTGERRPGNAPTEAERAAAMASATGDVVYGAAAVDGALFVRTGTELICIRNGDAK